MEEDLQRDFTKAQKLVGEKDERFWKYFALSEHIVEVM